MRPPKYRIGLLVDGLDVPKWVDDLAAWAVAHHRIELVAVIVGARPSNALDTLLKVERRLFCRQGAYRLYAALQPIEGRAPVVDSREVAKVREFQLDAIANCSRERPGQELLDATRDGVVSLAADGFAEVIEGRADTPFAIERMSAEGRAQVLFSGSVATALLYAWTDIAVRARAFAYLQRALEQLASGNVGAAIAPAPRPRHASARQLLTYAVRTGRRSVHKAIRRFSGKEFNWQVAVAPQSWPDCAFEQASIVPNPANAFLADPFTIEVGGTTYLFVEEFPFDKRKGVISAFRLDGARAERIGVVLEEPWHLSFPFVFEHEGEVYMVPEGGGGRSVKLYKASSFPTGWNEVKTLLAGVAAVDTVLFEHGGRWWMLTTIQGEGPGLNNAELHAFHADSPLGEWTPHTLNPIVMNAGKGRNGGFVRDRDGRPCRVAQAPGFTFYGAGSAVYRIDELTPGAYQETLMAEVRPTFFPNLDGAHHIHCTGGVTVFDFMRVERPRRSGGGLVSRAIKRWLDAPRGFEPRLTESESVVLPLDDGAAWEAAR